jgi:hypothetical protein
LVQWIDNRKRVISTVASAASKFCKKVEKHLFICLNIRGFKIGKMTKLVSFVLLLVIHNIEGIEVLSLFHSLVFSITWMLKPGVQNRCLLLLTVNCLQNLPLHPHHHPPPPQQKEKEKEEVFVGIKSTLVKY